MTPLQFVWDPNKEKSNYKKHHVSFEEAKTSFYDEHARFMADPEHSEDEERFILLGVSVHKRLLTICHCYRETESIIRIISARLATKHEKKQYEVFL